MTDQVYKTAAELGLTEQEFCALVKVRAALADGTIPASEFNMNVWWGDVTRCGTVGCIGGWADKLGQVCMSHAANRLLKRQQRHGLDDLFYPHVIHGSWRKITPAHACKAIDNYLTTGEPHWREVMK